MLSLSLSKSLSLLNPIKIFHGDLVIEGSCLIIAGEKSGEEHAMSFLPRLMERSPELKVYGVGGDEMSELGVELIYHLRDFSSWGFSEVIGKIPFYFKALNRMVDEVVTRETKYAILVDFQDFNLRLAKRLSKRGVQVFYYVAPQAWAWKAYRARAIEENVNTLFTIIPFEKQWFEERGVNRVQSVPHPLWFHYKDQIDHAKLGLEAKPYTTGKKKLLLLPGSRNFEVQKLLPTFAQYVKESGENFEVAIVESPNVKEALYEPYRDIINFRYKHEDIAKALEWTDFSLAASGTVTLTCALFEVPTVVCYSSSLLNEYIFYTFLSYDGPISLANIVHQKMVFPELIQNEMTTFNLKREMGKWLHSEAAYNKSKTELAKTLDLIGGDSQNVGDIIFDLMSQKAK